VTTSAKAKAFRPFVERLVTRAVKAHAIKDSDRPGYVHSLRVLRVDVPDRQALKILVEKIAPLCTERRGGYTRIVRDAKNQLGDNAPRVIWEFVDRPAPAPEEAPAPAGAEAVKADGKGKATAKPAKSRKGAAAEGDEE
jgi:large subunit ribosomal protein L17